MCKHLCCTAFIALLLMFIVMIALLYGKTKKNICIKKLFKFLQQKLH